jgi:hypothetical protein
MLPRLEALLGRTFETRKTSSRRPVIASATTVRRRHASRRCRCGHAEIETMAQGGDRRCDRGRYTVPCPSTGTSGPVPPNFSVRKITLIAAPAPHIGTLAEPPINVPRADLFEPVKASPGLAEWPGFEFKAPRRATLTRQHHRNIGDVVRLDEKTVGLVTEARAHQRLVDNSVDDDDRDMHT